MRRVILESPFAGDTTKNIIYARICVLDSLMRGEAPLASHLLYPQLLNDKNMEQRTLGIEAGHAWLDQCEAVVVYQDLGISPGMKIAIGKANIRKIRVEYRNIYTKEKANESLDKGHTKGA